MIRYMVVVAILTISPGRWLAQDSLSHTTAISPAQSGRPTTGPAHFQESGGVFSAINGHVQVALNIDALRASSGEDSLGLRLSSWGRGGVQTPIPRVVPRWGACASRALVSPGAACLRRVELARAELTEFWQPTAQGFEHGWDVPRRPPGSGLLGFHVEVLEANFWEVDASGLGVGLRGSRGGHWRYDGLVVRDRNDRRLAAWIEVTDRGLLVWVDDSGAEYPITVDPILTLQEKLVASNGQSGDEFGISVSSAGDVNGDGYDDVVVGAWRRADPGPESGTAYLYLGGPSGVSTAETPLGHGSPAEGDECGWSVAGAGDVNGDGYDDVIVGCPRYSNTSRSGSAYVYFGGPTGIIVADVVEIKASDHTPADYFGFSVAGAGDVDGDGYDDVIIGHPGYNDSEPSAYLYRGGPDGIDLSTETKLTDQDGAPTPWFGGTVSGAGDVNGDGYDDVMVGIRSAIGVGVVHIYMGSAAGIEVQAATLLSASDGISGNAFGWEMSGAGDVNGDGYDDIVIGAAGDGVNGEYTGSVYVYQGGPSGIDPTTETKLVATDGLPFDILGNSVGGAGDLDGDGYDDVIAGSMSDEQGELAGALYVYYGGVGGVDPTTEFKVIAPDGEAYDELGVACSIAGDVNGDGYDDIIVGARYAEGSTNSTGAAYLFGGSCPERSTWYPDADLDGYGSTDGSEDACVAPPGYVHDNTDCDDLDPEVHPGAIELTGDGVDSDCDGLDSPATGTSGPNTTVSPLPAGDDGCGCHTASSSWRPEMWALWLLGLALHRRRNGHQRPSCN